MKKVTALLLVAAMLLIGSSSFAEMRWGIKAGVNMATFIGDDAKNFKSITGFNAGVYTGWKIMDVLTIQPELLYSVKGGKGTLPVSEFPNVPSDIRLNYLELPILVKYVFPMDPFDVNVFAGPYFAQLMQVTDKNGKEQKAVLKYFSRFDWGLVLGVGGGWDSGFGKLVADIRYSLGLSRLDDDAASKVNNSVVGVDVGYEF